MIPFVSFPVGEHLLSIPEDQVRARIDAPVLSPVPLAPPWLVGLWNHLGQAVAVVDPALLAGLNRYAIEPAHILIVETSRGALGLAATGPAEHVEGRLPRRVRSLFEIADLESGRLYLDLDRLCAMLEDSMAVYAADKGVHP